MFVYRQELKDAIMGVLDEELEDKTTLKERISIANALIERMDGDLFTVEDEDFDDEEDESEESPE